MQCRIDTYSRLATRYHRPNFVSVRPYNGPESTWYVPTGIPELDVAPMCPKDNVALLQLG